MIGPVFLLFYIYIFIGYIIAFVLTILALIVLLHRPRRQIQMVIAITCVLLAVVSAMLNFSYLQATNPDYQQRQQKQQALQKNQQAARDVDFPVYVYSPDSIQPPDAAEIVTQHPPIFVLYTIKTGRYRSSMFQYKTKTKPYSLPALEMGDCTQDPHCLFVGKSTFEAVYNIPLKAGYAGATYFSGNGQTNIFVEFDEKITSSEAIDFFNHLKTTTPKDLPF